MKGRTGSFIQLGGCASCSSLILSPAYTFTDSIYLQYMLKNIIDFLLLVFKQEADWSVFVAWSFSFNDTSQ